MNEKKDSPAPVEDENSVDIGGLVDTDKLTPVVDQNSVDIGGLVDTD